MSHDARLAPARSLLHDAGFPQADVETAGHDGTIAVITRLPVAVLPALAAIAPRLKALGFRYVTIDITESLP
jgi:hypothetical protein